MSYHFEMLESRLLLAAGIRQKGANLIVTGSAGDDSIEVLGTGAGSVRVSIDLNGDGDFNDDGEVRTFDGVKNLKITTGGGNDRLLVDGLNLSGKFSLNTGAGNDTVAFGSLSPNQVGGKTNINLGAGDDGLYVEDTSVAGKLVLNGGKGNNTIDDAGGNSFPSNSKLKGIQAGDVMPPPAGGGGGGVIPPALPGAPVATDDLFDVDEFEFLTGNLITGNNGNGADTGDGVPFQLTLTQINGVNITNGDTITLPNGAKLTVFTNGNFTFDPGAINAPTGGYVTSEFSYTISDGDQVDTAVVSVRVHDAPPVEPVAVNDNYLGLNGTEERVAKVLNVLANDTHIGGNTLKVTHVAGTALGPGGTVTLGSGAKVRLNIDGTLTYDPNGMFNYLSPVQQQIDTFNYQISDGAGGVATATVQIEIQGTDNLPVATNNQYTGNEDSLLFGNVISNNTGAGVDADDGFIEVNQVIGQGGIPVAVPSGGSAQVLTVQGAEVTILSNGTFQYNPATSAALQSLQVGESASDSFTYQIVDDIGQVSTATVMFTIAGRNDVPTDISESFTLNHNDPNVTGNLLDNAVDPDSTLSVAGANVGAPITLLDSSGVDMGTVTISSNGNFVINPNENYVGGGGTVSIGYTVTDGLASASPSSLTITISGNSAPSAQDDHYEILDQNSQITGNLVTDDTGAGADLDPDGNPLTITQINGVNITNGQVISLSSGAQVTISTDGAFVYNPNGMFNHLRAGGPLGQDTFQYTISDGRGGTDTAEVRISITGVNDAPVAVADALTTTENSVFVSGNMFANDMSIDVGDTLTLSRIITEKDANGDPSAWVVITTDGQTVTLPSGAVITVHRNGEFIYAPNGADNLDGFTGNLTFQILAPGEVLDDVFWYEVSDSEGAVAEGEVTVTVTGVNDAPSVSQTNLPNLFLHPGSNTQFGSFFQEIGVRDVDEAHGGGAAYNYRQGLRITQVNYGQGSFNSSTGVWTGGTTVNVSTTGNPTVIFDMTNFGRLTVTNVGLWSFDPLDTANGSAQPVVVRFVVADPASGYSAVIEKVFDVDPTHPNL